MFLFFCIIHNKSHFQYLPSLCIYVAIVFTFILTFFQGNAFFLRIYKFSSINYTMGSCFYLFKTHNYYFKYCYILKNEQYNRSLLGHFWVPFGSLLGPFWVLFGSKYKIIRVYLLLNCM